MNLVSYEYVACQSDNAGVLVLSEFAGGRWLKCGNTHMDGVLSLWWARRSRTPFEAARGASEGELSRFGFQAMIRRPQNPHTDFNISRVHTYYTPCNTGARSPWVLVPSWSTPGISPACSHVFHTLHHRCRAVPGCWCHPGQPLEHHRHGSGTLGALND